MRVLFLESHPMWIYGLPNGFRDLGHDVRVSGMLTRENIPEMIKNFRPDLAVTMGWTRENTGYNVYSIRENVKAFRIPHVYWATEDPTHTQFFTLPLIKNMKPDFVFTICPSMVDYYRKMGIKCEHMDFGYHPDINCPVAPEDKYICNIAVVANAYPDILNHYSNHYRLKSIETLITPLVKNNIRVDFWGREWDRMERIIGKDIPEEWIHGSLSYEETSKLYSSADIVIGLQNHPTQLTQRTYEILASKGLLLTSDTPEIRRLFTPDKDLLVSSSPDETLMLVDYYLENIEKGEEIKINGEIAVKPYSYTNRARYMLDVLHENKVLR